MQAEEQDSHHGPWLQGPLSNPHTTLSPVPCFIPHRNIGAGHRPHTCFTNEEMEALGECTLGPRSHHRPAAGRPGSRGPEPGLSHPLPHFSRPARCLAGHGGWKPYKHGPVSQLFETHAVGMGQVSPSARDSEQSPGQGACRWWHQGQLRGTSGEALYRRCF